MEFKRTVGTRRTTRYYQAWRPVEKQKIQKILHAARLQSHHGNAQEVRKAVVVTKGETPDAVRDGLIDAVYNQPQAHQAPVAIVWCTDLAGWEPLRPTLLKLIETGSLTSSYGWSEEFVDSVVMKTPDFNVLAGDIEFAKWLSSFECGLGVGSALLAATDEGLGTGLVTGRRDQIRELLNMPESVIPTQIQLVGYAAESIEAGGQRPRPDFEQLYFDGTWGNSIQGDPEVVDELAEAGMIQSAAPLPHRKAELRALAGMFGLPE
ncbi:nitroreductase family protein [Streptomyces sp. NPDC048644]|uniref:nitroreductase family protein n=1 Tax=Streptomyces sp. NPDC048644 TaxID=3365582 RepID=UPI00371C90A7